MEMTRRYPHRFSLLIVCVLAEKGQCFTFGSNQHGQMGCSSRRSSRVPYLVPGLQSITMAACGDAFTLVIGSGGSTWRFHLIHTHKAWMQNVYIVFIQMFSSILLRSGVYIDLFTLLCASRSARSRTKVSFFTSVCLPDGSWLQSVSTTFPRC